MVVSEVGFQAQSFYNPQPRTQLNVRPAGCTGRRRLPVSIDWDKIYQLQFLYGISEYCAALILGYSLSSFYRHKKLRKDGFEKPYTLPAWVDICDIGRLQKLTGWSERKCAKHLEIPMTTYYRWREWLKDGVIPIECPGSLDHHNETPKERLQRYLHSRTFMKKRKCRNNPNPKSNNHWKPVEIAWDAIKEMRDRRYIAGERWISYRKCALSLGYSSTSYYRYLKFHPEKERFYDRPHGQPHRKLIKVKLEKGTLSLSKAELSDGSI